MQGLSEKLIAGLCAMCGEAGRGGGLVSPSVYDTAQVLRYHAPADGGIGARAWLLSRQHKDGSWGDSLSPLDRDVPTLAAVLALRGNAEGIPSMRAGLAYLRAGAEQWLPPLAEDIPIGVELILPRLLDEAAAAGIDLPQAPYAALRAMGEKRRGLIAKLRPAAATTPVHSWEAWGAQADPALLDGAGGMGHSPSATAAWLHCLNGRVEFVAPRRAAKRYLAEASAATQTGVPGVVPTVFPIARFEELFLPYALLLAGLLDHPALQAALRPVLDGIEAALRKGGLGFSDHFTPDGDDTAAGVAVLIAAGRAPDLACVERFENGDYFCTWPIEMNPSLSTTARGVHALALGGRDVSRHRDYLVRRQAPDGRWKSDKWNDSWLYATCHVVAALDGSKEPAHREAVQKAVAAICAAQHADGGWGARASTPTETAYAVLALLAAKAEAPGNAFHWLRENFRPNAREGVACWIGKESYRPYRVDTTFELIALLALSIQHDGGFNAP